MAPFCLLHHGVVFLDTMGNLLPMLQVKSVRTDTGMSWKIDAETFGLPLLIPEFIITMAKLFNISQPGRDLPIIGLCVFMKIKPVIFGSPPGVEQAVTMGNLFEILQLKKDFPIMILLLSWKTKLGNYGLAQGASPVFMMEKHLPFSKTKMAKRLTTF